MFYMLYRYVVSIFIRMLQKYIGMLHILQWLYTYVARACLQCFIRRML
jgi:hypothetical protein